MKKFIIKNRVLIFWLSLIIISFILFICFIYSDILITVRHSVNLWQTIYIGEPLGFYKINQGLITDRFLPVFTVPSYEFPIFIIFALWNFPLWIAQNFLHIQITESILCLFWLKSLLLVFLLLCVKVIKKICVEIGIKKNNLQWVLFVFLSSPLLLISLFIMSQYDIIAIFFMLLGVLAFIRGDKKQFILWFSIAIPLKLFALFIFIPLLLIDNKKIMKIINYAILGLLPLILTKSISLLMPMYKESTSGFSGEMLSRLLTNGINVNFGNASLFCISMVAICVFCYFKDLNSNNERNKFSIYIPLLVFSTFFIFVNFHPYWIILLTPFLAIIFFQNMRYFKINIILETVFSIIFIIITMITYYWCYGPLVIERMILPRLIGSTYGTETKIQFAGNILVRLGGQKLMPFLLAVFVSSIIAILYINFPRKSSDNIREEDNNIEWGLLFFRLLVILPVPLIMILCYYYK